VTPSESLHAALSRILERTQIETAISYGDFPKAERLIVQHVDAEVARIRTT